MRWATRIGVVSTHHAAAARALWVLAALAFVATAASAVTTSEVSLTLVIALVVAIAATSALVAVTREPAKSAAARRGAQSWYPGVRCGHAATAMAPMRQVKYDGSPIRILDESDQRSPCPYLAHHTL
ncbi:hypothetical protein [Rhodococcus koreensis]|uniref:hypothetical protein n=1 Tax=Rhodococcus koreensis TaxID=99653 RepID=UPI0036DE0790